ncbi:protein FAM234A isoform X2 [Ambystoma mexicanum]|uniref:protein FAM234A isoform X2 n=1 Tax=Ambystoma mexicanum TaxID=8296 RepID=UPI0037E7D906
MDNKDLDAEIHPLTNEEGKTQENCDNGRGKVVCKGQTTVSKLSQWRTAAFFASLFLCLIVVFAFSFIIPCPVRPHSVRTWSRTYDNAVTYPFLSTDDVNKDKVLDVLFMYKSGKTSNSNISCSDEGLSPPCVFMAAVSGTNGTTLWERPVTEDVLLVECGIERLGGVATSGCMIIGTQQFLTALNFHTGEALWQKKSNFGTDYSVLKPLLKIPDVDGDGIPDLMVLVSVEDKVHLFVHSGKNGHQISHNSSLDIDAPAGHLMHVTNSHAYYVLFYTETAVSGYSLKDLFSMTTNTLNEPVNLKQDRELQKRANSSTGRIAVPLSSLGKIRYLVKVPGYSYENVLVVKSDFSELVDGKSLQTLWTANTTNVLSKPTLGYFKKDVLDIVVEVGTGVNRKKVMILDSTSGSVHWELELSSRPGNPKPETLRTGDHRSTFLFWGDYQTDINSTESPVSQNLYMLHSSRPKVILELKNNTEQIAAFDGEEQKYN